MPFKSEKQRRFLWAEHPDIAKRWAHEYPKSNKNLPMYADKKKPENAETSDSKEKAATFNIAEIASRYVDNRINHTINIANTGAETIAKTADSKQEQVDIPHSEKPTYAGEEREKGEIDSEIPDGKNISGTNSAPSQNAINDLLTKFSVVLSPHIEQTIENMRAEREGRVARRIPRNRGLKRYSVAAPSIPLPYGMAQNQPQNTQNQQQNPQQARPVGGGSNPLFNPINAFGAISATGVINGNAAFGQKNSPDSSKIAQAQCENNSGLAKITSMDFPMQPDPEDLEIEDDERTKQANIFLKALPFLARMGRGAATAGNIATRSSLPNVVIRLGAKSAPVERFLAHYMHSLRRMDTLSRAGAAIPKDISKVVQFGNTFINGTRPSLAKMSPEIQKALQGAFQQAHLAGRGLKADITPEVAKHLKALAGRYSVPASQLRGWGNYRMTAQGVPELLPPALPKPNFLASAERWADTFGKNAPLSPEVSRAFSASSAAGHRLREIAEGAISPNVARALNASTAAGHQLRTQIEGGLRRPPVPPPVPPAGGIYEDRWAGYFKNSSDDNSENKNDAQTPCSCGCGDTVDTCKCSSSCSCKQPSGSCYQKPKEKDADMVKYSLEDMLKSARCWAGYEPVPGKKPYSEDSCRPIGSGKKKKKKEEPKSEKEAGTPAWQRSEGKNPEGGLNAKGRASYKAQTGGTLKAPVTESNPKGKRAKRQNSFCSRMCGMKRVNTGEKAKSDPDSRINKSLRKWNCKCSSAMTFGALLANEDATTQIEKQSVVGALLAGGRLAARAAKPGWGAVQAALRAGKATAAAGAKAGAKPGLIGGWLARGAGAADDVAGAAQRLIPAVGSKAEQAIKGVAQNLYSHPAAKYVSDHTNDAFLALRDRVNGMGNMSDDAIATVIGPRFRELQTNAISAQRMAAGHLKVPRPKPVGFSDVSGPDWAELSRGFDAYDATRRAAGM